MKEEKGETTKRRLRVHDDAGAFVGLEIDAAGDETTTVTNNVTGERTEVPCFIVEGWSLWLSRARRLPAPGLYAIDAAGVRSEYQDVLRALNKLRAAWQDATDSHDNGESER